jgi:hypothetical protein
MATNPTATTRATAREATANRRASGTGSVNKRTATGPYSRALDRGAVGRLNGNSREAKFIKAYEAVLTEHVGGHPSATQKLMITRAARLACHLELWDERTIPNGGAVTASGHNHYIAWANSLARLLARLGLAPTSAKPPSVADLKREALAARGAAA